MQFLPLYGPRGRGLFALIDGDTFAQYGHLHWQVNQHGYVYKVFEHQHDVRKQKFLHRLIMGANEGETVDHIDGMLFDLRRQSLRICTTAENSRNMRRKQLNTSGFKGVTYYALNRLPWRAQIMYDYQKFNLGNYATAEEAAYIYDQFCLALFGDYARCNLL